MTLSDALSIAPGDVVALVGAGGKTTAMLRCASELRRAGRPVIVTTTTKIYVPRASTELALIVDADHDRVMRATAAAIAKATIPVVGTATTDDAKLVGVPSAWVRDAAALAGVAAVLVEADGSARLPITAPRDDEPVIPACATLVVAVVGIDALGGSIADVAHRPDRVSELTALPRSATLDAAAIARVLLDPRGNTRGVPANARIVVLINKADDDRALANARTVARAVRELRDVRVVIASLEHEGVRAVIA
ncbi:MAG TPA: selenium cofactor biosynthesis protein YqeC [Candidatus Limnocylindria bacterium]